MEHADEKKLEFLMSGYRKGWNFTLKAKHRSVWMLIVFAHFLVEPTPLPKIIFALVL
jgi:hypothetical protein